MSKINSACLKISRGNKVVEVKTFTYAHERNTWLLNNGFIDMDGVYQHIDGRTAGKFQLDNARESISRRRLDDIPGFRTCDKPVTTKPSMWNTLLGAP